MSSLRYQDPGELRGTPIQVAAASARMLEHATKTHAGHVASATRQIRNGWLSAELDRHPELTPAELAERWDKSPTALYCLALVKHAKHSLAAAKRLS